jgi:hypothetical protein
MNVSIIETSVRGSMDTELMIISVCLPISSLLIAKKSQSYTQSYQVPDLFKKKIPGDGLSRVSTKRADHND